MRKHRFRHGLDIVGQHIVSAGKERIRLCRLIERDRAAGRCAEGQRIMRSRRRDDTENIALDGVADIDLLDLLLQTDDILRMQHGLLDILDRVVMLGAGKDHHFLVLGRIAHADAHEESVHLCFGQMIGAVGLDGILRCKHHERHGQLARFAVNGDLMLLHDL